MTENPGRMKEITVKRLSAFRFEIEVSVGVPDAGEMSAKAPEAPPAKVAADTFQRGNLIEINREISNRISVIRRAPPSLPQPDRGEKESAGCDVDKEPGNAAHTCFGRVSESNLVPAGAILIEDAILYRIIEILLWKVLGEKNIALWGYPATPTYRLLWNVVHYYSHLDSGSSPSIHLEQEHDCQGDINCFMEHVGRFLELCAPTHEKRQKFGWVRLSRGEILKKIYYEDLLPFLISSDLSGNINILNSYEDILRLQKWQEQGFTAISWNGHRHFSRLKSRFLWCPKCTRHLKKSVISRKCAEFWWSTPDAKRFLI